MKTAPRVIASSVLWCLLAATVATGPSSPDPQTSQTPQVPTFRANVEITPIDVTVLDRDGKPIENLKADEFQVQVDGKERRVVRAEWVPLARPNTSALREELPEGYSSNQSETSGRLIVIAIDQPHIRFDGAVRLRTAVNGFIDRVPATDPIAAAGLGHAAASTPFTIDRPRVKKALELMSGQSQRGQILKVFRPENTYGNSAPPYIRDLAMTPVEALDIYQGSTNVLDSVAYRECKVNDPLTGALVLLTGQDLGVCRDTIASDARGIGGAETADRDQTLSGLRALLRALVPVDAPKTLVLVSEGFSIIDDSQSVFEISSLAAAARTSIYALKLDDRPFDTAQGSLFGGGGDREAFAAGLDVLASASRGGMFNVVGDGASAIARMERELSGYYLLGVESVPADTDGKAHPIKVQVSRPGVEVRARRELAHAPTPKTGAPAPLEALTDTLSMPLPATGLPMRVATFSMRDPKSAKIHVAIHADIGAQYTSVKPVSLAYLISDAKGDVVVNQVANGTLGPVASWAPAPLVFTGSAVLDPGNYTLKLAVMEGDRVGSVEHPIRAQLTDAGSLKLSELMIGGPLDARALSTPTIGYEVRFGSVQGYIEAYGSSANLLTMKYEIAPSAEAPSLFGAVVPGRSVEGDRTVFSYALPVKELAPGRYYLRASLSSTDSGTTLSKTARGFTVEPATLPKNMSPVGVAPTGAESGTTIVLPVADAMLTRRFRREDASRRDTLQRFRDTITPEARRAFDAGTVLFALGDDPKAQESFKNALAAGLAGTDSSASLAYLGASYAAAGQDVEAIGIWQIARVDAAQPQLYEWLADALMRTGNANEARATLEEAFARWPGETRLAKPLALLYAKGGGSSQAFVLLVKYLNEHAEDSEALALGVQWMAEAHAAGGTLSTKEGDVRLARSWADAYAKSGGPQADAVKRWMTALETER